MLRSGAFLFQIRVKFYIGASMVVDHTEMVSLPMIDGDSLLVVSMKWCVPSVMALLV